MNNIAYFAADLKKTKMQKILLIVFLLWAVVACTPHQPSLPSMTGTPLQEALAQAGPNRKELEKVLQRYSLCPEDSLKYRATCFLIENMPYYRYWEGELLNQYLEYYRILKEMRGKGIDPSEAVDSIQRMYGIFDKRMLQEKKDIETVDSAYLCHNIEWAFKVWQEQPWGKNVLFGDFCEYILPYRIGDEALAYWREYYYNKYNCLLDSLRQKDSIGAEDPIKAAICISQAISHPDSTFFTSTTPAALPHIGPEVAQLQCGACRDLSDFLIYICRALGIPCATDFMPLRGNDNVGHTWVALWDKYGELYYQEFPDPLKPVRLSDIRKNSKVKIYRNTFSLNRKLQHEMRLIDTVIAPLFENPHFVDVTFPYAIDYRERIDIPEEHIYPGKPSSGIAYLCINRQLGWSPVAWGVFDRKHLHFDHIDRGDIMRVATIENGKLALWTDPFLTYQSGELHFFSPKDSVQDMTLLSKYHLGLEFFRSRVVGGVFEGSNDPDFREKDTLFVINEVPERLNTVVDIPLSPRYRYIRYYGAEGSNCNIAEVIFYGADKQTPLTGKIIGTPGCVQNDGSHEYPNVFDGKTWTSFDYKEASGGWAGLDLEQSQQIARIVYTPRNRDNYIRPGDDFELFYCDKTWKSAGRQTAVADSLVYHDMPVNTLFLLRNYSRGNQERIFTYENGRQIWK